MTNQQDNLWEGMDTAQTRSDKLKPRDTAKPLPEDHDAERAFLGTVLAPGQEHQILDAQSYMAPEYFSDARHRYIWEAAVICANSGIEVNAITLTSHLGTKAGVVGGFTALIDLISHAVDYENPKPLARIIKTKWEARTAISALARVQRAIENDEEVGGNLSGLQSLLGTLAPQQDSIIDHNDLFDLAASGSALLPHNLSKNLAAFGVPFLDTNFVATPRRFGVIAAKTSAGKSSMAYQICVQSASAGQRVLLVSLESDKEEVAAAMAANMGRLNRGDIMKRGTRGFESDELVGVKKNFGAYYASSGSNWDTLERAIRQEHRRRAFDVVIVDYFTLLQPPEYKGRNLASLYGEISKAGKRLAQELECSVIFLSQFNRGVEDGAEPQLENLRETGQLEQDADWVMLMWANPVDENDGTRIVYAKGAKNRGGKRGFKGAMTFFPDQSRFVERIGHTFEVKASRSNRMS